MKSKTFLIVLTAATANAAFVDAALETPISLGIFHAGDLLSATVTGIVNLADDAPGVNLQFNPDGSLNNPSPASCSSCWVGYEYMLEGSNLYPTVAGGDGVNHFAGGGANYDLHNGSHSPWAAQGAQTTDTLAPGVIRFGALAQRTSQNNKLLPRLKREFNLSPRPPENRSRIV